VKDAPDAAARYQRDAARHRDDLYLLVRLTQAYEDAEPGTPAQTQAYRELREAFPNLDMPTRLEPRSAVIKYLEADFLFDERAFADSIDAIIARRLLADQQLFALLSLLAASRVVLSHSTVFDLLEDFSRLEADPGVDDAYASLMAVAGRGPGTIMSLLERLEEFPTPRPTAIYAALETVASNAPEHLGAAFANASRTLEDNSVDPTSLAFILGDLCKRAGPYTVLLAIAEQDPWRCPKLTRAAFAEADSPFQLAQNSFEFEERQEFGVVFEEESLPLTSARVGVDLQKWLAAARSVLRAQSVRAAGRKVQSPTRNAGIGVELHARELGRPKIVDASRVSRPWLSLIGILDTFFATETV